MEFWDITASQVAQPLIEMAYGQITSKQQYNRQKELMRLQMMNQKELNAQGQQFQLDMWNKTNYAEQMKQLSKAGLNPALLYGKGGGGGATTGSGSAGTAAGGQATQAPMMDLRNLNFARAKAELDLLAAQADNQRAEAEAKRGYQADQADAYTGNLIESTKLITTQIGTEQAKQLGIQLDNSIKALDLYILDRTKELKVEQVEADLDNIKKTNELLIAQVEGLNIENSKKAELINSQIKLNNQKVAESYFQTLYTKAQTELTKGQTENLVKLYNLEVQKLQQNKTIAELNNKQSETNARIHADAMEYAANMGGAGNMLGTVQRGLAESFGKKTMAPQEKYRQQQTRNVTINNYGPQPTRKK